MILLSGRKITVHHKNIRRAIRVRFSALRYKRAGKQDYERFTSDEDVRFYEEILKLTARNAGISKNECTAFCVPCDLSRLKSSRDSRSFIVGAVDCFSGVPAQRRGRQDGCDTGKGSAAAMPVAFSGNGRRCMNQRVAQAVLVRLSGDQIATNG
jgi:hypothetical protein